MFHGKVNFRHPNGIVAALTLHTGSVLSNTAERAEQQHYRTGWAGYFRIGDVIAPSLRTLIGEPVL